MRRAESITCAGCVRSHSSWRARICQNLGGLAALSVARPVYAITWTELASGRPLPIVFKNPPTVANAGEEGGSDMNAVIFGASGGIGTQGGSHKSSRNAPAETSVLHSIQSGLMSRTGPQGLVALGIRQLQQGWRPPRIY